MYNRLDPYDKPKTEIMKFWLISQYFIWLSFFDLVGNVQNHGYPTDIVSGEIDRRNKTWIFEAENETKFRATLLNGNMVNGTGNHSLVSAFTFTVTTTNWKARNSHGTTHRHDILLCHILKLEMWNQDIEFRCNFIFVIFTEKKDNISE